MTETKQKLPPKGSQNRRILERLADGEKLSSYDAFMEMGIARLPNRIGELKKKYGAKIRDRVVKHAKNPKIQWKEYWIEPDEQQKWLKELYGVA